MIKKILLIVALSIAIPSFVSAGMSSTNYNIPKDVLNQSGGTSTSTNYMITHSLGESVVGYSSSTNYQMDQGFIQPEEMELEISFSIAPNSIDFGSLSHSSVSTESVTLTTTVINGNGYTIQAYDNTPVGIAYGMIDGDKNIADATTPNTFIDLPSAGTEHFGLTVTGTNADADYVSGTKINSLNDTTWARIASYDNAIEEDIQYAQFRVSISNLTPAGQYRTITTFICTGNF